MNIVMSEPEYCKLVIQYESNAEEISEKRDEVITQFKSQPVKGFRQGKAPIEAVKMRYRKEIERALVSAMADDAVNKVISEKDIKPIGRAAFSQISLENSLFRCEFSIHKQPDFALAAYKEFEIPKISNNISAEELAQKMLQDLRTKYGTTTPYSEDDFIQENDNVIVDYKATENGDSIADLTAEGELLNVGKISITGFSENLYGMKIGETRFFDILMTNEFKPEYTGRLINFEVKLVMGSKIETAPLDDNLAKSVGLDTFAILMENVQSTATTRISELEKTQSSDQITRRLIENHPFIVPNWIALAEAQANAQNASKRWDDLSDSAREQAIKTAGDSVKLSLILQKVRDNEPDAQLSDEEVYQIARANLAKFSKEPEKVMQEVYKNGHINVLFNRIKDEYTLDFIYKTCKFVE